MTDLLSVADALYAALPGEFTAARNARVKEVRGAGDKELADRIHALRKPAQAAWVVNMLMRHDAEEMTQVLELGVSLRQAQADLDGEALRELTRQRRRLVAAVTAKGRRLAAELGEKVSDAVARQVEDTLHAAMVDEEAADAVRTGMLTEPLASTGLGTLDVTDAVADGAALGRPPQPAPRPAQRSAKAARPGLSAVPDREPSEEDHAEARRRAQADARAAVAEARAAADKAGRKLDKAVNRADKLNARRLQVRSELDELRRRVAELEHREETLDDEIEEAQDKRKRAEARHREAVAELEAAQQKLDQLGDA